MNPVTDSTLDDPQRIIAELQRANAELRHELLECRAERDEAIEQRTAIAEVLGLINSSSGNLAPVFDAILEKAHQLCSAARGVLALYDGEYFRAVAIHGYPEEVAEEIRRPYGTNVFFQRIVDGDRYVQIPDFQAAWAQFDDPVGRAALDHLDLRTWLAVPLRKEGLLLGYISAVRSEVRPFSDKEIALLENFAAQAVIAMENARLSTETREALDQQTATAEVLGVINSSPGDLAPVFDAILGKALALCAASCGSLQSYDGKYFHQLALQGPPELEEWSRGRGPIDPGPDTTIARIVQGQRVVQVIDMVNSEAYRVAASNRRALVDIGGFRTLLSIALHKDEALCGALHLYRSEARPFTDKQVALLENFAAQAVIAMENARLITETREALDQQTATAEVLAVINSSPGDLAPVFDAMLEKATRLCTAPYGQLAIYDGEMFRFVAAHGEARFARELQREPHPPSHGVTWLRILGGEDVVHVPDVKETDLYRQGHQQTRDFVDDGGGRSLLSVALRKDDALLGILSIYRQEPQAFTDKQIALLQNFAVQAVIAIENARLITETREALEQQTATAELLGVINASPGDLVPLFEAMLEKAMHLCGAAFGELLVRDRGDARLAAAHGVPEAFAAFRRHSPARHSSTSIAARIFGGQTVVHTLDAKNDDLYRQGDPQRVALVDLGSARTTLAVALVKDQEVLGLIHIYRQEVRPFTNKQIALLQNFAAQAVIAVENARLMTETQEALEQQTATAEVLGVINSSPGDLAPVFDAILEKAMRLCEAAFGQLWTYDGERFHHAAGRGLRPAYADFLREREPWRPGAGTATLRVVRGEEFVHILDLLEDEGSRQGDPVRRAIIEMGGARTQLAVPLCTDNALLGIFVIFRQEVRPFSEKQIALVKNFAAQVVIAMENARLITETREALDQQTATAEVLAVINASPGDLAPVFEAMLDKALRLCDGSSGTLQSYDGTHFHVLAVRGHSEFEEWGRQLGPLDPAPGTTLADLAQGKRVVQITDMAESEGYRTGASYRRAMVDIGGFRSILTVALHRDEVLVGALHLYRKEARRFTDKQVALLQSFAAQAVIAMENARLITETREALDRQTATAEVLEVINSSPGDLTPVFNAILEKAHTVCGATLGTLFLYDGEKVRAIAMRGYPEDVAEVLRQGIPSPPPLLAGERLIHVTDLSQGGGGTVGQLISQRGGVRTNLIVPLRKDRAFLGMISCNRKEVRPYTDQEIALIESFAAQAVIAMENARLITETREALDQQTATAEVLGVINASPGDLAPVFDAMLEKAMRLCDATFGTLWIWDGEWMNAAAVRGASKEYTAFLFEGRHPPSPIAHQPLLHGASVVHLDDIAMTEGYRSGSLLARAVVELGGVRTLLAVPLRKDGVLLGVFSIYRSEVRPFTDKQTALLQSFAAQAVIAMENARLLDEIRHRQAELRVTFDNMGDGVVMFDAEHCLAAWNRNFQELLDLPDALLIERPTYADYLRLLAERGEFGTDDVEAELARRLRDTDQELRLERERPDGRVIEVRRNAVPDGGFVLIYSDITERKRSEEDIRTARDAAEAAYRDLKAAQANLIQAEKMASLGQLTAGIAHEIKNPLNFVNNFASLSNELLEELKDEAEPALATLDADKRAEIDETLVMLSGNLEKIAEHGQRADNIVKSMLEHSRGVSGERREVDLNALLEDALNLAYHGARAQDQSFNITLERDYAASLRPIELAPQEMTRVFLNLFGNGFYAANKRAQAADGDSSFRPVLAVATREEGGAVEVRVRDNGTGIPPEIKDKLFQPFFTTKPTGEGTGLGLSISYDIVTQQHGGTITVESEPGVFSEFTVRLPRQ